MINCLFFYWSNEVDKSLFETIEMETLYENKSYIQLVKSYEKRIEKLEKDHQKV